MSVVVKKACAILGSAPLTVMLRRITRTNALARLDARKFAGMDNTHAEGADWSLTVPHPEEGLVVGTD
jgi:hypothetical protein